MADDKLEPGSYHHSYSIATQAELSIAISLKRIADNMDKLAHPPVMVAEASQFSDEDWEEAMRQQGYIVSKP